MSSRGGGHSKGQKMPYAVVYAWGDGKPSKSAKWTLGAAQADMQTMLRTANSRDAELDVRIIDQMTGETVETPQRCLVCGDRWATEFAAEHENPALCFYCEPEDLPTGNALVETSPAEEPSTDEPAAGAPVSPEAPAVLALSAPLVQALRAKGLEPVTREDGTVTATANGIDWTLESVPHAVTGEPCGVWSAASPVGPRGMFGAEGAANFITRRTAP